METSPAAAAAEEAAVVVEPPGQEPVSETIQRRPPPRITFSDNSSSLIRCIPNERATFFVKIDCDEDEESEMLPFKFEWSRGEIPIENSDRFRITQTSNAVQLAVEHVQREDAGHYTLFARTKSNDVVRRHVELIVEDRSTGDDPPVFLRRLVDLSVKVGTRTRLLTEIRSSTDLKLTWYRNDRRVCENDRITEINEGTFHYLEVSPVTLDDGGQWMLMAENFGGRNSCLGTVNVLVPKAYKTPEFVEELRAVLTEQGTVSLECKVVGVPTPHLRWFKDSKEIKAGDIFALTANADDPTSLGTYTCEARNCMGVTYSSSKVHVVGRGSREGSLKPADNVSSNAPPPIFTNELRDMSIHIGETIILGCQVVVPPWPKSVSWYNTDGRVETAERYKLIEDGLGVYMIEIKPSESCDAGEWKCVVTSFEGCVGISTCAVNMDIPRNYRKPRFMESLRAVLTEEGLVSFECKVVGFPTPVLKWFKDGHELKPGDVYQLTGTNSLGTYCCIARNCMGETSSTAVLTVEDIQNQLTDEERMVFTQQNQAPKFLTGLKSTDAKINEPFQFKVAVKATPDPILSWFRDELPIDPNDRYNHYRGENDDCWLLDIKAVEFVDQAEWKCVAVNDFGTSITSCFLKLQIPRHYKKPRFLECLRAVLTEEGAVNLECKVIGVPQPVLKWYKDGVELKPGDIHRIISGQDGTCCLGTYTCEARNCMGVVASSASLLGFEDAQRSQSQGQKSEPLHENELQRNYSLSTIQEERTSQMYETPVGDITIDEKGDVSFSFDGKEVSVSLYETPDLTEEEALKIVEMYADQISEHVTEHNIVELPPLRFVKETSQSGKLLMEAVVIDIAPEYFSHEEDMRTEADMDDISITEITVHGSSGREGKLDKDTQQYVQESFEKMEEELSLSAPIRKRKKSRPTETDEFFSLSKASASGSQEGEEETSDLQTFASAQMSTSQKVATHSASQASPEQDPESLSAPKRKKSKKPSADSDSSKTNEDEARLQDISGAVGDGLLVTPKSHPKAVTDESEINRNLMALVPLAKLLKVIEKYLTVVENEVVEQSTMMMTAAAADQSIAIIRNIIDPIKQIESKLRVYSGETQIDGLIQSMDEDIRKLHMGLQVIEKCVEIDETGATLIQRTSVCIIDSVADQMKRALEELKIVSRRFESECLRAQIELTADDIQQGLDITQGTIKSQALLQEAQELEAAKHFTEAVEKMQDVPDSVSFATISEANLPSEASALKEICHPVARIQEALERVEMELSLEDSEEQIYKKVHQKVLESIVEPIKQLQSTLQSIEDKTESLAGSESMEQKINMAILDIVTPPLFELNKGLEVILNEKSDSVEGGMLTVSTVESMVPPLQEIQNGLAQLGQDLESGQAAMTEVAEQELRSEPALDVADTQKLLQSFAQAVLHFETNIERISPRLSSNVKVRLLNLKDELSALIGTILDRDITRHHVELLDRLKRPVDELNYCIRQTEVKTISGSLADLIEPLSMLQDNTQKGHGLLLIAREPDQQALQTLDNIRSIIRNAIIDIEEHEFKILQQEIQEDEQQASQQQQDKSFSALRRVLETKVSLDEAISNIETLQVALNKMSESPRANEILKASANEAQVSLLRILQIAKGLATFSEAETTLDVNEANTSRLLFECGKSFADLARALDNPADQSEGDFLNALHHFSELVGQQNQRSGEKLSIAGPLTSLIQVLERVHPLRASVEDLSETLDDVSVLKSIAESLPTEPEAEPLSGDKPSPNVGALLADLNHGIASVLSHCEDVDVTSLASNAGQQVHAIKVKMQELQNSIALVQETNFVEAAHSLSESSHQGTFAEALCSLERCVLHVEECIAHSGVENISELELSKLKTLATPLRDVREYCEQIDTHVLEHAIDLSTQDDISDLKTSGHKQTVSDNIQGVAAVEEEPRVELFDIKQGVASGIKQLEACLEVTQTDASKEIQQVGEIMEQLKSDLKSIQAALVSDNDQQETVLAQAKIARTMFKLKECLVHTYESGLVDSLENVESAFEDILLSLPVLETQLAEEMFGKIEQVFKNFVVHCQSAEAQELITLKAPIGNLLHSIEAVAGQPNVDIEKSSAVVVQLQTSLMAAFRSLNEVSDAASNELLGGLLKTQSSLVTVFDFIENNENSIRIIELLQEIDSITGDLNALNQIPFEQTVPIDIGMIIENVSSGKAFLTEIEEGLQANNPQSILLLDENTEDIAQLESTLIQIEKEILCQPQLTQITAQQFTLIETLQLQLNNLKEKLTELNVSLAELHKESESAQESEEKEVLWEDTEPETKKPKVIDEPIQPAEKDIRQDDQNVDRYRYISETPGQISEEQVKESGMPVEELQADAKKEIHTGEDADKKTQKSETLKEKLLDLFKALVLNTNNEALQSIVTESQDIIENLSDVDKVAKSIFKLREHIVHTYDGKPGNEQNDKQLAEEFIEDLLAACPDAAEQLIHNYLKEIKTNVILTKASIQLIDESNMFTKPSLLVPKLVNLERISEKIQSTQHLDKSSEKMISLQQNLMDTFIILDDLLDEKTEILKPKIDEIKTILLGEYDYIEKKQGDLHTAIVHGKIHNVTQKMLNICEDLKDVIGKQTQHREAEEITEPKLLTIKKLDEESKLSEAKTLEKQSIQEQQLDDKMQTRAEEDAETAKKAELSDDLSEKMSELEEKQLDEKKQKKAEDYAKKITQQAEDSEVAADNIPEEKIEESKKADVKDSEAKAKKAKSLEKQQLEEKQLDEKKQKQTEKDAEKMVQKAEESEVVAEKICDEQVEESKKADVKDSEAKAQKAKSLEKQQLEEKQLDDKKQKQTEKDAEKMVQKAEESEVVAEKISDEQVEESKKADVKDSEAKAQKAKSLEKQQLEEKQLDEKKQKQTEKNAEKMVQKAEESEVIAEKICEEKVEESKKADVKDSEAKAQKAKSLEKQQLEEKQLDDKKQKQIEKDSEKMVQKAEESEVVAEKISDEQVEESKTADVKDSEAKAQKAKSLEQQQLEEKQLDDKKQKQTEKDAEKMVQKAEESEVIAEKISEEQVEERKKAAVKDSEAKAPNAKSLEKQQLEEKQLDEKKQKQTEKDAEKMVQKAEESEVVAEKICDEQVEESKKADVKDSEAKAQKAKSLEKQQLEEKQLDDKKQKQTEKDAEKMVQKAEESEVVAEKISDEQVEESKKADVKDSEAKAQKAKSLEKQQLEEKQLDDQKQKQTEKDAEKMVQKAEESEVIAEKISEEQVEESKKAAVKDSEAKAPKAKALEKQELEEKQLDDKKQKQTEKDAEKMVQKAEESEVVAEKISDEQVEESKNADVKDAEAKAQKAKVLEKQELEEKQLDEKKQKQTEKNAEKMVQKAEESEVIAEKISEEQVEESKKADVKDSEAKAQKAKYLEKQQLEEKKLDDQKQKQTEKDAEKMVQKAEESEVVAEKISDEQVEESKNADVKDAEAKAQKAKVLEKQELEEKQLDEKKQKQTEKNAEKMVQKAEESEVVAEKISDEQVEESKNADVKDAEAKAQKAKVLEKQELEEKQLDEKKQKQTEKNAEEMVQKAEESEVIAEKISEEQVEESKKADVKDSEAKAQKAKYLEKQQLEEKQLDERKQKQTEKDAEKMVQKAEESEVITEKISEEQVEESKKADVKDSKAKAKKARALEKQPLEEKQLDEKKQKQTEKDAEKMVQKAEESELIAEKISEEQVEESKKADVKDSEAKAPKAKALEKQQLEEKQLDDKKQQQTEKDAEKMAQKAEGSEVVAEKISEEQEEESKKADVKDAEAKAQKAKALEKQELEEKQLDEKKRKQTEKDAEKMVQKAEKSEAVAEKISDKQVEESKKADVKDADAKAQKAKALEKQELEEKQLDEKKQKQTEMAQKGEESKVVAEKIYGEQVEESKKADVKDSEAKAQKARALEKQPLEEKQLEEKKQKQTEKDFEKMVQKAEESEVIAEKISEEQEEESKKADVKDSEVKAQKAKALEKQELEEKQLDDKKQKQTEMAQKAEESKVVAEKISEEQVEESKKADVKDSEAKAQKAKSLEKQQLEEKQLDEKKQKQTEKDVEKMVQKAEESEVIAEKISEEQVEESKKADVKDSEAKAQKAKSLEKEDLEDKQLDEKKQKQTEKDAEKMAQKGEVSEALTEKVSDEPKEEILKTIVTDPASKPQGEKALEKQSVSVKQLNENKQKQDETVVEKAKKADISEEPQEQSVLEGQFNEEQEVVEKRLKQVETEADKKAQNVDTLKQKLLIISQAVALGTHNEAFQLIVTESQDIIENLSDVDKVTKSIFKLREHIVHTYDGKPGNEQNDKQLAEEFIEDILAACPDAAEQLIHNYLKEIKTNVILTKASIQLIDESNMFTKPSLLVPKLVNLERISEKIQSTQHLDKSSEKMISLQQNLMDTFIILDDLLDEKTEILKPKIDEIKTILLGEYDYIEKKQGDLHTAIVHGKIHNVTQKMLNICEDLKDVIGKQTQHREAEEITEPKLLTIKKLDEESKLSEAKTLEKQSIQEQQLDDKMQTRAEEDAETAKKAKLSDDLSEKMSELEEKQLDEKKQKKAEDYAKKMTQQAEDSEVVADNIPEEKIEESKKADVKDSEAKAKKAKSLEKQQLEEKQLDEKKQKQTEKDAEKMVQKAEESEVVAEKICDEQVEESKKADVKDSEAKAQKAKSLEKQQLEEKQLDDKKQKQTEKDAEKMVQKAEESEVVAEKISDEQVEESKKADVKDSEAKAQKAKSLEKQQLEEKQLDDNKQKQTEKDAEKMVQKAEESEVIAEKISEEQVEESKKADVKDSKAKAQKAKALEKQQLEEKQLDDKKQQQTEKDAEKMAQKAEGSEVVAKKISKEKLAESKKADIKDSEAKAQKAKALEKQELEEKQLDDKKQKQTEKDAEEMAQKAEGSEVVAEKISKEEVEESQKSDVKDSEARAQKAKALEKQQLEEKQLDEKKQKQTEKDAEKMVQEAEESEVVAEKISEEKLEESKKADVKDAEAKAQKAKAVEKQELEEKHLDEKKPKQAEKDAGKKAPKGEESEVVAESKKAEVKDSEAKAQKANTLEKQQLEEKQLDEKKQKQTEKDSEIKSQQAKEIEVAAKKISKERVEESKKADVKDSVAKVQKARALEKQPLEEKQLDEKKQKQTEKDAEKMVQKAEESEVVAKKISKEKLAESKKADVKDSEAKAQKAKALEKQELEEKHLVEKKQKQTEKDSKITVQKAEESEVVTEKMFEEKLKEVTKTEQKQTEKEAEDDSKKVEVIEAVEVKTSEKVSIETAQRSELRKIVSEDNIIDERKSSSQRDVERNQRVDEPADAISTRSYKSMDSEYKDRKESRSAKRKPTVDIQLTNRNTASGSDLKLTCGLSGHDMRVEWFKQNTPIENGAKYRKTLNDGLSCLEIKSAELNDSGIYRCIASNQNGEVETSCLVTIYEAPSSKFGTPPIFTRNIRDAYHSQGNSLTLECKVSGSPKPHIYWQRDNTLLPLESKKYQYAEQSDGVKLLTIANFGSDDSGLYTCYAESENGQMKISKFVQASDYVRERAAEKKPIDMVIQEIKRDDESSASAAASDNAAAKAKAKVREDKLRLSLETSLKTMTIGSGNKAQMICYVTGFIEDVHWLRNEERVTKDSRHKIYNINGAISLEIYDARVEDSGYYRCVVKNSKQTVESAGQLSVLDQTHGQLPESFSSAITESYDAQRNEIVLSCQVHGRPSVSWMRDDHTICNNRYKTVEEPGGVRKLIIRNPISSDCGIFACYAEHEDRIDSISTSIRAADLKRLITVSPDEVYAIADQNASSWSRSTSHINTGAGHVNGNGELHRAGDHVMRSVGKAKPLFHALLHDRTVSEGVNLRMVCAVSGDENTHIEWLKNHKPLPRDTRYQTLYQNGEASLEIYAAVADDSGNYTCAASNDFGESLTHAQLRVYKHFKEASQPSTFTQPIRDTYSLNENELVLDCRVRGQPRPDITWMKGNEILSSDEKYQLTDQADGYAKLVIVSPTEKDSGVYSCVARNEGAENKMSHQVDFKGRERYTQEKTSGFYHRDPNKPHFLTPLGNQTVCDGGTVAISAEFMQTTTPLEVKWLRDRQVVEGPNVQALADRGVYTLTIMKATSEVEGTYTCRASNAYGRIESHANVDVAVGAEKDERPPLFLSRPDTEMKIAVGDPFSFAFRIAGEPKPKLTFMKGTKDITQSDRVSKEVSDDYTRFTVQQAQISDSGTYFVVARNNFGTDRIFVTVTVNPRARSATPTQPRWGLPLDSYSDTSYFRDPPGCISTEPLVVDSGPTHISLSWGKPVSANSAPVIAYKVEAWILGHEGGAYWRELGLTPINSFDAFNLKPNVEYHFRVTPKNRYGWGPAVQTSSAMQVGGVECLPEFVKILPGQVKALFGSSFTLQCNMRGAPRPTVTWYKDGIQLSSSSERVRIRQIGSTCALTIATVSDLDSGRYTCEATNSKGRVSTFARLQVVSDSRLYEADSRLKEIAHGRNVAEVGDSLPIFTMRLRDRRVQVTYPVRLTCQIVGYPVPEILWYKDEELINADRRHLITADGQFFTLEIAATTLDMSGIYTCLAKNELGSVSCHCNLVVDKGIRAYISPDFYVPLDPFYVFPEGSEIRLSTKVEAYPAVGVTWHRNGMRLRPSRRLTATLDSNGYVELIIAEATVRDAGIYVCVASNVVGKVETICRVAIEEEEHKMVPQRSLEIPSIKTDDLPYSKDPLFVVKPRSSEAYEGDNVIIFCEVVGDPKPEVVWLRDFLKPEYYKDAPHFRRIGEGPEYRLEIPSAKLDFTGTYSVIASNCHGEAKAVISLQIFAKDILKDSRMDKVHTRHGNIETLPRFVRNLRNLRCCDGDAISLECHVEAMPEPYIIWEKDGHVVPSDRDYVMSYDGTKAILSIPRVYPEDEGEYTCVAKNSVGRTLSSACIIVDVPEEKENMLSRQLTRPSGLLSAHSTPRSTPRSTPNRSFSPMRRLSYRTSSIDLSGVAERRRSDARNAFTAPKFLAIPYNRVVEEGDNVRFQCAIGGHPTPWATWDKDGLIVTPTTRIAVKEVDDLRFIEIDEVSFDDAGLYRITLENDFGRIEATARLDVIRSSRYSKSPSVRSVRASSSRRNAYLHRRIMGPSTAIGGRMALASGYRGSSVPSVRFYHNNMELEPTDRVHILLQPEVSMAMLIVDNVTREDEGVYTCIISGDHDPLISSTSVTFHEPNTEQQRRRAVIAEPLAEITKAVEGEAIDLCCLIDCDQPYSYLWLRNGEILPDSDEFNYIDHGNGCLCLRLNEPFDIDSGTYSCQVFTSSSSPESNDILLQNSNPASASAPDSDCDCSSSGELCVLERDLSQNDEECIQLLKTPLPVVCGAGEEALFYARVFPCEAEAVWYLNGKPLADEADDSLNMTLESYPENGIRVLRLRDVQPSKSGEIRLQIKHPQTERRIPTARTYTSLLVLPIVRGNSSSSNGSSSLAARSCILTRPEDCTALIGGHVRLSVRYDPFPGTKVIWYKACRAIVEGSNVTIRTSSQQSTLYITDISADDSGKYTVEIMNDYGVEAAAASVAVEGPPEPPSGQPSVSPGPDRMAVAWCGPPYDGGCMITGFIIEMQSCDPVNCDKENDEWQQVARVVDTLAYTVKNLQPQMQYRFRVRAENIHGRSAPSQASELVQMSSSQYGARAGESTTVDYGQAVSVQSGGDFKARFEVIEELGKGRFGIVYKVQERDQPQQLLAAKVIKCIKSRDRQKVLEEISIMRSLQHPKLLQLAASFESPREIVMVMEYITGGELFERVVADDFTLTELDCILFLRQVCEGVAYMHSQSVVHLDLKPENIMCHTRTSHQIKIIDFGLAQRLDTKAPVRVLFGTPEFIPPEIISYEPIDFKSDMWSVGVICYVLLSGLSPFMGDTDVETFSNITRADYDYDDEAFDCVSQEAKDFISQLLVHRKEERLTAKQCLESKWLCQRHDDNLSNNKICTDKLKKFIIRRKWQKSQGKPEAVTATLLKLNPLKPDPCLVHRCLSVPPHRRG
ncbi:titin isoform X8 [Drosophila miranda]|uniref:titin isoform X8 n=1 Tax=Drosophila miranda TaxID=7229 RepID=UPI00143F6041|nr:titin isoform X8 [Drosophila miranda]